MAARQGRRSIDAWFSRGLKFSCTECGKCCSGRGGKVYLNSNEAQAISSTLEVPVSSFAEKRTPTTDNNLPWVLKRKEGAINNDACIFLKDSKCSIYNDRPTQCRTFPFWPQHLVSPHDWNVAAKKCEGIQVEDRVDDATQNQDTTNDVVTKDNIVKNLIFHGIHKSGEEFTFTDMEELFGNVEDELIQDFQQDFISKYERQTLYEDAEIIVFQNKIDDIQTRSLVLKAQPQLTQTEMRITEDTSTEGQEVHLDFDTLLFDVHQGMALALHLLIDDPSRIGVLGSGGGSLVMFLARHFPNTRIDAVDFSSDMFRLATDFFNLSNDPRIRRYEMEAEKYLTAEFRTEFPTSSSRVDLLLMDVAGSFQAVPPLTLIGQDMIYHMAHNVLSSNGVLVVNAIASESEIELLGRKLKRSFARVEVLPLPSNYVIFAFPEIEGMPTFGTLKNNERLLSKVGLPPSVWKSMFSL